jgi:ComEC/Rec2-related protein
MRIEPGIILFCYAYIVGIGASMAAPSDPGALPVLSTLVAVALATAAALGWKAARDVRAGRDGPAAAAGRWLGLVLAVSGLMLGYTRQLAANTEPDMRLGTVVLSADGARYEAAVALPDAGRVRLARKGPLSGDVALLVIGELDARVPVRDTNGLPTLDAQGRWRFAIAPLAVTSDVVTVRAADPGEAQVTVPQPFTRITSIRRVSGPGGGEIAVHRVSNHAGAFARSGARQAPVRVLGYINADPLVYDFKTVLPVTPQFIQSPAGGPFLRVEGGDIQVTVRPDCPGYAGFADARAYGRAIEVDGVLTIARGASNPGGFDARRYLRNTGVHGLLAADSRGRPDAPVRFVDPADGAPPPHRNALVSFSLGLRDRITRVIKATVLYPESAFVGGVTLGLRYGLQNTECIHSPAYRADGSPPTKEDPGCDELIANEFKAAGVNHVLAVSGLHVTIITVMFVGIFAILRVPRQYYTPVILLALVVFAIITGARPSTLRAVIMNSLTLMTWAYIGRGLRSSVLLGVPVAAFLILVHNPLVVVDPSFTLSFGAILSLGLLTTPALDLLQPLRGNRFAVFILLCAGFTAAGILHWPLLTTPQFLVPAVALSAGLFLLARRLERRGARLPEGFGFERIPQGFGAFIGSQFAIQLGMMVPLSTFYFSRWPFAGAYANLVAIPLIGINVQLGAMGGLLGLIPGIGPWIALVLGAANWFFSAIFLWIGHIGATWFPYPFARRPGLSFLAAYYILCAAWIWWRPLLDRARTLADRLRVSRRALGVALAAAGAGLATVAAVNLLPGRPAGARVTFLSTGYGGAALVESPGGQRILVDAGFVEYTRGRRNEATRTVIPYLCHRKIRGLDAMILLSARPERAGGAGDVLEHVWVGEVVTPPVLEGLSPETSSDALAAKLDIKAGQALANRAHETLVGDPLHPRRPALARALAKRGPTWANRWAGWSTSTRTAVAGDVLFRESGPGGEFRIEVLGPAPGDPEAGDLDNGSLVLRVVHGGAAVLLTGDLRPEGVAALAARTAPGSLRAQIVTLPHHGAAAPAAGADKAAVEASLARDLGALLGKVRPDVVLAEYGRPSGIPGALSSERETVHELTRRFVTTRLGPDAWMSTERDGAVTAESDGHLWTLSTQADANRAQGGEDDAVADIAVGF